MMATAMAIAMATAIATDMALIQLQDSLLQLSLPLLQLVQLWPIAYDLINYGLLQLATP